MVGQVNQGKIPAPRPARGGVLAPACRSIPHTRAASVPKRKIVVAWTSRHAGDCSDDHACAKPAPMHRQPQTPGAAGIPGGSPHPSGCLPLRPSSARPNRPTYVSLTGQLCCRAALSSATLIWTTVIARHPRAPRRQIAPVTFRSGTGVTFVSVTYSQLPHKRYYVNSEPLSPMSRRTPSSATRGPSLAGHRRAPADAHGCRQIPQHVRPDVVASLTTPMATRRP